MSVSSFHLVNSFHIPTAGIYYRFVNRFNAILELSTLFLYKMSCTIQSVFSPFFNGFQILNFVYRQSGLLYITGFVWLSLNSLHRLHSSGFYFRIFLLSAFRSLQATHKPYPLKPTTTHAIRIFFLFFVHAVIQSKFIIIEFGLLYKNSILKS